MADAPSRLPAPVPAYKSLSATMRVDALVSDWRAELDPELSDEARERQLYDRCWAEYLTGDFGFGLWCWRECDRLILAMGGNLRAVTAVLGPGRYLGFSHRLALADRVPLELVYRPRKGDMSTPRTGAIVLAPYQLLCVYAVRASQGDRKAKAQLDIALGELEERRRADPYVRYFENFRALLERRRTSPSEEPGPAAPSR